FEDEQLLFFAEIAERHVEADSAARLLAEVIEPFFALWFGPGFDRAFVERESGIRDDQIERIIDCVAEALAARTRGGGAVEAEEDRLGLAELKVVVLAKEALAEAETLAGFRLFEDRLAGLAIADLDRVHDALVEIRRDRETIGQQKDRFVPV